MNDKTVEILLIEDNPTDERLALHAFKKHNLADKVQVVRDGAEALEFIFGTDGQPSRNLQNGPRVILLDLKLPKIDGLQVLRQIKSDTRTKAIPVVILTSSREERDMIDGYQLGVNSYIQKPVDFGQFREIIKRLGLYWLVVNQAPPTNAFQRMFTSKFLR